MNADIEKIKREKFPDNNAKVLRAINMLRTRYVKLLDLKYALTPEVNASEITDSVNYLNEGGYIKLRDIGSHCEVSDFADAEPNTLEAKLTQKGIMFLNGKINDPCIRR